jgi:hypothetical protein
VTVHIVLPALPRDVPLTIMEPGVPHDAGAPGAAL